MKRILIYIILVLFISNSFLLAEPPKPLKGQKFSVGLKGNRQDLDSQGKPAGFSLFGVNIIKKTSLYDALKVKINYTDYYFVTEEDLPGYYIGLPMTCEVVLTNTGDKDLKDLTVTMAHEYYESGICNRYWFPPSPVEFKKGQQLPGETGMVWPGIDLKPGETVALPFEYVPPYETCSGLDQTHVIVENRHENSIIELYNESEAGVFCPPPPE